MSVKCWPSPTGSTTIGLTLPSAAFLHLQRSATPQTLHGPYSLATAVVLLSYGLSASLPLGHPLAGDRPPWPPDTSPTTSFVSGDDCDACGRHYAWPCGHPPQSYPWVVFARPSRVRPGAGSSSAK